MRWLPDSEEESFPAPVLVGWTTPFGSTSSGVGARGTTLVSNVRDGGSAGSGVGVVGVSVAGVIGTGVCNDCSASSDIRWAFLTDPPSWDRVIEPRARDGC